MNWLVVPSDLRRRRWVPERAIIADIFGSICGEMIIVHHSFGMPI